MSSFVDKLTLLNRLLDATRECQTQYSMKKEIMTERNSSVSCVCRQFEDVLSHGIKQKPIVSGIATIQNVTGLQLIDQDVVFWHCIQRHLSKHEVERFNTLYHITTDVGRGRAWLRSSLNEHSLERVFQIILSDIDSLKQHYSHDAFLLDEEKSSLLPQIASGLKAVMFSIKIDDPALNNYPQGYGNNPTHKRNNSGGTGFTLPSLPHVSTLLGHEVAMDEFPEAAIKPIGSSPKSEQGHGRRKKKARTKIITFGQNGRQILERPGSLSSHDDIVSSKKELSSSCQTSTPPKPILSSDEPQEFSYNFLTSPVRSDKTEIESQSDNPLAEYVARDLGTVADLPGDTDPSLYLHDKHDSSQPFTSSYRVPIDCDDGHSSGGQSDDDPDLNTIFESANTTSSPMVESFSEIKLADELGSALQLKFDSTSDLSSLNDGDNKSIISSSSNHHTNPESWRISSGNFFMSPNHTDSTPSSGSFQNEILCGSKPSDHNADNPTPSVFTSGLVAIEGKNNDDKSCELQKALVVLLQRKDELAEENEVLKELLRAEKQHSSVLKEENERLKSKVEDVEHSSQVDARKQLRENDVLRNQLKKYVGAVHALQYGKVPGVSQVGIPGMEEENSDPTMEKEGGEAKVYEQKLIEVTEMHGELMEFTESLHTRFLSSLALIHKMHDELVALRGPMPTDNVIRAIESDKPRNDMTALPSLARALVNVWVPSAFTQGSGPDSHHVYQVYICMEDDEWNVYRRYSDFHILHNMLCKSYPEIQNFGFPPKKGIGNRNSKFVEERRKAFQKYLRLVMHNVFQNNTQLKACPTKETLLHILPFFSDAGDQFRVIVGKHKK